MNALVVKRKGLSVVVVVLILMSLTVPVAMAAPQPPLVLPTPPVIPAYVENNLDDPSVPAYLGVTLSGFSGNYSVSPGILYNGWCVELDIPLVPNPNHTDTLYSTYPATNLPDNAQFYRDPLTPIVQSNPSLLNTPVPWDKLNYLLNHKLGTAKDVQTAIWSLIWGAIPPTFTVTPAVTAMLTAANDPANANFVPAVGQIIGVFLYNDGIGHVTTPAQSQEIIIELTPVYDLGDLPQPPASATYPTLFTSGPSHELLPGGQNLFLGACVDAELDGQPDTPTTGDDTAVGSPVPPNPQCTDDEDGVVRTPNVNWQNGAGGGSVNVTVTGGAGCLSGWIDWNGNGILTDAGDNILNNVLLTGTSTQPFTVPVPPGSGTFYARFRLYPTDPDNVCTSARTPTGPAVNGEVEDYRWSFGPNAVTLSGLQATTVSTSERLMAMLRSWLQ